MTQSPRSCPKGNVCRLSNKDAAECGTVVEHFAPDLLPEQVCSQALIRAINDEAKLQSTYSGSQTMRMFTNERFRTGSLYFDLARSKGGLGSRQALSTAQARLDDAAQRSITRYYGSLNAALLQLYVPYVDRTQDILEQEQAWDLQEGLLNLADRVGANNAGHTTATARLKIGFHLLFATRGIVAMPVTARENGMFFGTKVDDKRCHDFYTVDRTTGRKIPQRLLFNEKYCTDSCINADFNALATQAIAMITRSEIEPAEAGKSAFNLLYDYTAGHGVDDTSWQILDTMGAIVEEQAQAFSHHSSSG